MSVDSQIAALIGMAGAVVAMTIGKLWDTWLFARQGRQARLAEAISREASVQVQAWKELSDYRRELRVEIDELKKHTTQCDTRVALLEAHHVACLERITELELTITSLRLAGQIGGGDPE